MATSKSALASSEVHSPNVSAAGDQGGSGGSAAGSAGGEMEKMTDSGADVGGPDPSSSSGADPTSGAAAAPPGIGPAAAVANGTAVSNGTAGAAANGSAGGAGGGKAGSDGPAPAVVAQIAGAVAGTAVAGVTFSSSSSSLASPSGTPVAASAGATASAAASAGATPVAGGLIHGAHNTPRQSSAAGGSGKRAPSSSSSSYAAAAAAGRTPGTRTPSAGCAAVGTSGASTPGAGAGGGGGGGGLKSPVPYSAAAAAGTPSAFTPSSGAFAPSSIGTGTKTPSAAFTPSGMGTKTPSTSAGAKTPGTTIGNNNNVGVSSKTPPAHNYSNTHTPIASAKRPRASLGGRSTSRNAGGMSKVKKGGSIVGPNSVAAAHTIRRSTSATSSVSIATGVSTPSGVVDVTATSSQESANSKSSTDSLKENKGVIAGVGGGGIAATATGATAFSPSSPTDAVTGRVATPVNLSSNYVTDNAPPPTPGLPMSPMHPPRPMRSHSPTSHAHGHGEHDGSHGHILELGHDHLAPAAAIDASVDEEGAVAAEGGGWKINNIFSPVLHFLGGSKDEDEDEEDGGANANAGDLEIEKQQNGTGVGADLEAEASAAAGAPEEAGSSKVEESDATEQQLAAAEGLVNLNESGADDGYATAEEGMVGEDDTEKIDVDGDVTMEDVEMTEAGEDADHLESPTYEQQMVQQQQSHPNAIYQVRTHESSTTTITTTYHRNSPRGADCHEEIGQEYSFDASVDIADSNGTEIHHTSSVEESVEIHVDDSHDEEEDEEEFNPYLFIKSLPSYHHVVPYPNHKICLPPKEESDPPIALVLDLDETLVHCTVEPIPDADMVFPVVFNGVEYSVNVRKRPYLEEFLQRIAGKFEVIVFTASQQVYADELLDRIDPEKKYIKHRMFRESCLAVEGNYLKDLNVCGRDMNKMVLVDNSPHAFGYQVDNGIPIESWFDDPTDTELLKLERFLRSLHGLDDVRKAVRDKFRSWQLIRDA